MLSRIHQKLGTAGFVIAIVALVAALSGTAIALTGNEKKQVKKIATKIAKQYAGEDGKDGKDGANGINGTNGAPGPQGPIGPTGPEGPAGPAGDDGPTGPTGLAGDDGTTGTTGPTGPTGPANIDTLPPGDTETGAYSIGLTNNISGEAFPTPIDFTFNIPLPQAIANGKIGWVNQAGTGFYGTTPTGGLASCPGTADAPEAKPGFLCIYTKLFQSPFPPPNNAETISLNILHRSVAGVAGDVSVASGKALQRVYGTWAVTSCGTGFPCP